MGSKQILPLIRVSQGYLDNHLIQMHVGHVGGLMTDITIVSRETSSLDQVKAKLRSFLDEGGPWTITKDEWATYKDLLFM